MSWPEVVKYGISAAAGVTVLWIICSTLVRMLGD